MRSAHAIHGSATGGMERYTMNKGKDGSILKMVELGQGCWIIPRTSPLFYSRCLINQQYKKSKKPKDNNIRNKK